MEQSGANLYFSFNLINFESCKFQVEQELGRKVTVHETMFNSVEELNQVLAGVK